MRWQKASASSTTCKKPHKFSSYLVDKYKWSSFIIICSAIMKVLQTVMLVAAIATASGQNVSFLPLLPLFGAAGDMTPCSTEFSSIHTDSTHEEFMCLLYDMDRLIWSRRAPVVPVLSSQSFDTYTCLIITLTDFNPFLCKILTPKGSKSGKSYSPTYSKSSKAPTTDSGKSKSGKGTPAPTNPPTPRPTNPVSYLIWYYFSLL